jgi:FkbM family methyltransferase
MRAAHSAFVYARTLAERASRSVTLKRRLPIEFGGDPIFVSPASMLKFWSPKVTSVDPALVRWASEFVRPGDVVWDVGSNVGLFSLVAASVAGKSGYVLAIEPDTFLVELMRRSVEAGSSARAEIAILPAAISDQFGVVRLNVAARGRAANFIEGAVGSTQTGGVRDRTVVVAITLDWLYERFPRPSVVKLDIEGAEVLALRGGEKLLATEPLPIILCEVRETSSRAIASILSDRGYSLFDVTDEIPVGPLDNAPFNTLAWPAARGTPLMGTKAST